MFFSIKQLSIILFLFLISSFLFAQNSNIMMAPETTSSDNEYSNLIDEGKYEDALEIIEKDLSEELSKKVERKTIPSQYITFSALEEDIDVNTLFSERTLENFNIEDNEKLHRLYTDGGTCYAALKDNRKALTYLNEALRYKKIEYGVDDKIFYAAARVYKNMENVTAYRNFLELSYKLNPSEGLYSKELGLSLYSSPYKEKAIHHLKKYVEINGDEIEDHDIYLKVANLNADIDKHLEAEKYYRKYLQKEPEDGKAYYSLGVLAYQKSGNFNLALSCFENADQFLDSDQSLLRSKSYDYTGKILQRKLKYEQAIGWYTKSMELEDQFSGVVKELETKISEKKTYINELKVGLLKENNYTKYNEYEYESVELQKLEIEYKKQLYELSKYNGGELRWNTAFCYEQLGELEKAIEFYKAVIKYNYQPGLARDKIIKIQLKIKRGY